MSLYNKAPYFSVQGELVSGWNSILQELRIKIKSSTRKKYVLVVECYQGVYHQEIIKGFSQLEPDSMIYSADAFYPEEGIK